MRAFEIIEADGLRLPDRLILCCDHHNAGEDQAAVMLNRLAQKLRWENTNPELPADAAERDLHVDFQLVKLGSGKPVASLDGKPVGISVSHSQHLICCGLYPEGDMGLDLEHAKRRVVPQLRNRILHTAEAENLEEVDTLRLWTMKEAVLKLTGTGLRAAMRGVKIMPAGDHGDTFLAETENEQFTLISFKFRFHWLSVAWRPFKNAMKGKQGV